MAIENRLHQFITGESNFAMVLSGGWGEGKTCFWKKFAFDHAKEGKAHRPNYAYVSLFGVNSLADLRNALAISIHSVDHMNDLTFMELLNLADSGEDHREAVARTGSHLKRWGAQLFGRVTPGGTSISLPHAAIGNIGSVYMAWAYHGVRNALICIDDIERRGSRLDLKDVLGLIADLVNERNCSVIAILNDGSFDEVDRVIWDESREKVFLGELRWHSSCDTSLGYVYDMADLSPNDEIAVAAIKEIDVRNIRIIQRMKMAVGQVIPNLTIETLKETRKEVIYGLVMITYARAGQGIGAPPIELLRRSPLVEDVKRVLGKREGAPDDRTSEEKAWSELLRRYGYHIDGRLDELLDQSVSDGYPDMGPLQEAIAALDQQTRIYQRHQAMQDAWDLYHDKVGDNTIEVIDAVSKAFLDGAAELSVNHADAAIGLVRELGDPNRASKMIQAWVTNRQDDRWKELSPENTSITGEIRDVSFREAIDVAYRTSLQRSMPDFDTLMEQLGEGRGYDYSLIQALALADTSTYLDYFRRHGLKLTKTILSLPHGGPSEYRTIDERAMTALSTLAHQSLIDRRRVEQRVGNLGVFFEKYPPLKEQTITPTSANRTDATPT